MIQFQISIPSTLFTRLKMFAFIQHLVVIHVLWIAEAISTELFRIFVKEYRRRKRGRLDEADCTTAVSSKPARRECNVRDSNKSPFHKDIISDSLLPYSGGLWLLSIVGSLSLPPAPVLYILASAEHPSHTCFYCHLRFLSIVDAVLTSAILLDTVEYDLIYAACCYCCSVVAAIVRREPIRLDCWPEAGWCKIRGLMAADGLIIAKYGGSNDGLGNDQSEICNV